MCKARCGEFIGCLSAGVLPSLIDAGFVFVLRWALDDSSADNNSLSAAVSALHATIVCTDDEVSAGNVLSSCACSNCVLRLEIPTLIHSFIRFFNENAVITQWFNNMQCIKHAVTSKCL